MVKKGKKKWIIAAAIVCVGVIGGSGVWLKKSRAKDTSDGMQMSTQVTTGTIQTSVAGTGTISYADTNEIVIPEDLTIQEVKVSEGSSVTEGTLLATVDSASLTGCIEEIQDAIDEVNDTITDTKSSTTGKSITAGVAGRVKKVYASEGENVADVMKDNGALMLISNDGYMAVKIEGAANAAEGDTVTVSADDTETEGTIEEISDGAAIILFEDDVFDYDAEVSVANADGVNLGSGTAYIHQPIQVYGTSGTIASVKVSEGDRVSASTAVITLTGTTHTTAYLEAVAERTSLISMLNTLIEIQTNGGIVANTDGIVETISVSGSGGTSNESNTKQTGDTYSSNENSEEDTSETVYAQTQSDTEELSAQSNTQTGGFMTMSTTSVAASEQSTSQTTENEKTQVDAPQNLEGGAGCIKGTTDQMEYGDQENATSWTTCSNETTNVSAGTWYVRYKETDTTYASSAVKVEVQADSSESTTEANTQDQTRTTEQAGTADNSKQKAAGNNKSASDAVQTQKAGTSQSVSSGGGSSSASGSSETSTAITTTSAFTIAGGTQMKVTMYVDELDVLSMKEGLEAEVILDAVEDTTFDGVITSVGANASSSGGVAQYPVEITFDKTEDMLSGMNASVKVILEQAENVLTIPLTAVTEEDNKSYVYTGYDESSKELTGKTEVTLGMSDENNVEVKSGLSEGDTIYYEIAGKEDNSDQKDNGMGQMDMPGQMGGGAPADMPSGGGMNGGGPSGGKGGSK